MAIVTGSNTGIGRETVLGLARAGARVYVACRAEAAGEPAAADTVRRLRKESGNSEVYFLELDLSSMKSARRFAKAFLAKERRLDVLVNNAGKEIMRLGARSRDPYDKRGVFYHSLESISIAFQGCWDGEAKRSRRWKTWKW